MRFMPAEPNKESACKKNQIMQYNQDNQTIKYGTVNPSLFNKKYKNPTNLFEKFGVKQVPTFYCVKGDKKVKVEQIDPKSLIEQFNSM
jgi:hypothetical protein